MKASVRSISRMTGFSPATVSNALNNKRRVNPETAEKIRQAAKALGYSVESRIRSVRLVIYTSTGAVVNDSPFFSSLFSGIENECRSRDLHLSMHRLSRGDADYEAQLKELLEDPSSALLILATEMEESEAARFQQAISPVIILDNWYEDLPFHAVLIDNTDAASKAVQYLIRKGHRQIGYLHSHDRIKNFYYRRQGYLRTLEENGLEADPAFSFALTPSMEGSLADMNVILKSRPQLPTAFFADNDMIALGAMHALQQNGYRIPEDISIVGFDDLPFCAISNPPLTTIHVFNDSMGRECVRRLASMTAEADLYQTKTQITSRFIERESVLDLNQSSSERTPL